MSEQEKEKLKMNINKIKNHMKEKCLDNKTIFEKIEKLSNKQIEVRIVIDSKLSFFIRKAIM